MNYNQEKTAAQQLTNKMPSLLTEITKTNKAGVFQNLFGTYPIEQAIEMFPVGESNFVYYATVSKVFNITRNEE